MEVSVYQNRTLIGTSVLEHLDPSMGVAFGPFTPSDQYNCDKHASTVEGEYFGDRGQVLAILAERDTFQTASIAIEDWADPEIGKHLTIWFKENEEFAARFSNHPDYRA